MENLFEELSLGFVCVTALGRVTGILLLKLRQSRYQQQAVAVPVTWRDKCTVPEPYLLGVTTLVLALGHDRAAERSLLEVSGLAAGLLLAVAAAALMLWALRSFPAVSTGHYVLPDHRVIREGPYAWVRHPLYLAAYLVWLALAAAFGSAVVLAITVLYVIPSYWIYMRAEEQMLQTHLGEEYVRYRQEVGMLFPRSPRHPGRGAGSVRTSSHAPK